MRFELIEHDAVDSTSERAFAALEARTARHGDVHTAREQTAGRGRRGASWASARGEGLYLSVVLLPERTAHPGALTMAGGLAAFDAARELGLGRARLKWPNDLVVDESGARDDESSAKLAGVLVETRGLDLARPHYVLGIGVNVKQREFTAELRAQRAVTSFALCGIEVQIANVREFVLANLARRLEQAFVEDPRLCADFAAATDIAGRALDVECGEERLTGRFVELSLRGIVLRGADGAQRHCALEHVRAVRRR
jgi:BirA family biotin operon repressor/biotin-[acetyl-CoA-carboxylase] ligase